MPRTRLLVVLSMLSCAVVPGSLAQDHILNPETPSLRLLQRANAREDDLAAVQRVLATPQASETMRRLGANPRDVRAGDATIGASELQELAARARMLHVDPAAGVSSDVDSLLVVLLVVAIVILVLGAVH